MKLTTKGRYAVTAMVDIALHAEKGLITVQDLSVRQGISKAYLERLTNQLRAKHLLKSVRGPGGGYELGKPPEEISICEIIQAVEEPIDPRKCGGHENCHNGTTCLTHHLWDALNNEIMRFLTNISLRQVIQSPGILAVAKKQMITIQHENNHKVAR